MEYKKIIIEPLPSEANQFCPHCGKQSYLAKYDNVEFPTEIILIVCQENHYFTMNIEDINITIQEWNRRV
jgi:ribosomal protein S27AE